MPMVYNPRALFLPLLWVYTLTMDGSGPTTGYAPGTLSRSTAEGAGAG